MKVIISTGPGRLHLIDSAINIKSKDTKVIIMTGWVPNKYLPDRCIDFLGKIVGRNNISYGLRKRKPEGFDKKNIISNAIPEFFLNILMFFSKKSLLNKNFAVESGWKLYTKLSSRKIKNIDIFHVRSGAGDNILFERLRDQGVSILVDQSAAHPKEIYKQISKAYSDDNMPFKIDSGLWKMVEDDCNSCDYLLVNSEYVKKSFIENGFNQDKIFIANLGIRTDFLKLKIDYDIKGPVKLLFTGNFSCWKGANVIINATKILIEKKIDFQLDILGTIANDIDIPNWFKECNFINLHGHVNQDELKLYFSNSDLYIFPSYCEGSAQSLKEAMGAGMPTISTLQSGGPIINMDNGIIIEDNSSEALFNAIILLVNDDFLRKKIGIKAYKTIKEFHTWDEYGKNVREVYELIKNENK